VGVSLSIGADSEENKLIWMWTWIGTLLCLVKLSLREFLMSFKASTVS
jgi:hypothetical protein